MKTLDEIFGKQESVQTEKRPLNDIFTKEEQPQQQVSQETDLKLSAKQQGSPLNILQRAHLAFADDEGRKQYLEKQFNIVEKLPNGKYAVGNNPNEVIPIDPEGIFNDVIGDLADVVGEIPVIAGQIKGAILGSVAGPAGTIAGGAAGSAVGETAKIGIGKMLGVQKGDFIEDATDVAISGAFGAAGESLAIGTRVAGKFSKQVIAPKLLKLLESGASKTAKAKGILPSQTMEAKVAAKLFNVLANIPEESTFTVYKHGIEKTLGDPTNLSKESVKGVVGNTLMALDDVTTKLSKEVGTQVKMLETVARRSGSSARIQVDDVFSSVKQQAQRLGILDSFGKVNKLYPNSADIKPVVNILKELGESVDGRLVVAKGKTISAKKAIQLSRSFGQKFETLSGDAQSILYTALNGDDALKAVGIRTKVSELAAKLGVDDFAKANKQFFDFMNLKNSLRRINPNDLNATEKFVKSLEKQGEFTKQALNDLQKLTNIKFLDKWEMWNAAQDFIDAKPNILRFGAIAATLGSVTGFQTKESKAATIGGALLFGTPAGLRILLRARVGGGTIPRTIAAATKKATMASMQNQASPAILSQLLKMKSKQQ